MSNTLSPQTRLTSGGKDSTLFEAKYVLILKVKVPSLKEVNFGKVKLWAVEHFWTDFDLRNLIHLMHFS